MNRNVLAASCCLVLASVLLASTPVESARHLNFFFPIVKVGSTSNAGVSVSASKGGASVATTKTSRPLITVTKTTTAAPKTTGATAGISASGSKAATGSVGVTATKSATGYTPMGVSTSGRSGAAATVATTGAVGATTGTAGVSVGSGPDAVAVSGVGSGPDAVAVSGTTGIDTTAPNVVEVEGPGANTVGTDVTPLTEPPVDNQNVRVSTGSAVGTPSADQITVAGTSGGITPTGAAGPYDTQIAGGGTGIPSSRFTGATPGVVDDVAPATGTSGSFTQGATALSGNGGLGGGGATAVGGVNNAANVGSTASTTGRRL